MSQEPSNPLRGAPKRDVLDGLLVRVPARDEQQHRLDEPDRSSDDAGSNGYRSDSPGWPREATIVSRAPRNCANRERPSSVSHLRSKRPTEARMARIAASPRFVR